MRAAGAKRITEDKRGIIGNAYTELFDFGVMNGVIKVGESLPPFALPNDFNDKNCPYAHLPPHMDR